MSKTSSRTRRDLWPSGRKQRANVAALTPSRRERPCGGTRTLDTYSHVLPDMQESAAELVAAVVAGELASLEE